MTRQKGPGKTYCIFPSLHSDVTTLLEEDDLYFGFRDDDDPTDAIKEYDTNIMGRFVCRNVACSCRGWYSMKIAITIRMSVPTSISKSLPSVVCIGLLINKPKQVPRRRLQRARVQAALPALQRARRPFPGARGLVRGEGRVPDQEVVRRRDGAVHVHRQKDQGAARGGPVRGLQGRALQRGRFLMAVRDEAGEGVGSCSRISAFLDFIRASI